MNKFWGILFITTVLFSCKEESTTSSIDAKSVEKEVVSISVAQKPLMKYGFNLADFTVKEDTVRYGDSFGELMLQNKVDYPKIARISQDFKDTFDVRRIRVGKPYTILTSKDTTEGAQVFIYENDVINLSLIHI